MDPWTIKAPSTDTGLAPRFRTLSSGNGEELATYVVEKGKPLITLVK